MFPRTDILVCQADSCRRAGSEAVLCEIEEFWHVGKLQDFQFMVPIDYRGTYS